jgi:hypothetical protein
MAGTRSLTVKFLGDAKSLVDATKDADGAAGKLGSGLNDAGEKSKAGFDKTKTALLGMGAGILAIAGPVLSQGTNLELLNKKAATVFEGSLGSVQAWSAANAKAMGLTKSEATGAAASLADLLKPMGFTAGEAAKMSTGMLDLSGALSAWSGGTKSATEVSEILSSAMLGETDGLKALGIAISADDVQKRLAANGTDKLTGAALKQATAIATQQLIMEQSTDAQKAWSDGSMDAAKRQNETGASLSQLKETIVGALFPALSALQPLVGTIATGFTTFTTYLQEHKGVAIALGVLVMAALVPAFVAWAMSAGSAAMATLAATWPIIAIVAAIGVLAAGLIYCYNHFEGFRNVVDSVAGFLKDTLWPAIKTVAGVIIDVLGAAVGWIGDRFGDLVGFVAGHWDQISAVISTAIDIIKGVFSVAIDLFTGNFGDAWTTIKGAASSALDWLADLFRGLPNKLGEILSGLGSTLSNLASSAIRSMWDGIKSAWNYLADSTTFTLPSISIAGYNVGGGTVSLLPHLARGGTALSDGLAMVGEEGAEIVRLSRGDTVFPHGTTPAGAGQGTTVIFNISTLDPAAAGVAVKEALRRHIRDNGPLPASWVA